MTNNNTRQNTNKNDELPPGLGWMLLGLLGMTAIAWAIPTLAGLLNTGRRPPLGAPEALIAGLRLLGDGHFSDPASAYPRAARAVLPGPLLWWLSAAVVLLTVGAIAAVVLRRIEPEVARTRLGRRAFEWRGAHPRRWGRHRDLRHGRSEARGFSLGRLDGRPIYADTESNVAVVAPTRAGKTTRLVIPWLLEHDGPAIVTSTDRDVIEATHAARAQLGTVWIFDPFSPDTMSWSPLDGCNTWTGALRRAQWLAGASGDGDSEIARYWRGEAAKLLAPLLHAAALAGKDMKNVLDWVDVQETRAIITILDTAKATAARNQLRAISELDPRNRGTTYMSTGSVLEAYRYPEVQDMDGARFTPKKFLKSRADTLFLVADPRHQQLAAPLFVALLSAVINEAIETRAFRGTDRALKLLLDEAANVAPLPDLPQMISQILKHNIIAATFWQDLAQLHTRYGRSADTILGNSTVKLFMGPITDDATRRYVLGLLDERDSKHERLDASAVRQLDRDRALLVAGARLPALLTLRPYWASRGHQS
jgi:type IV secretory pathway TraG/TraD family ATPase VirD4